MRVSGSGAAPFSYLDRVRLQSGNQELKRRFAELAKAHREQAVLHMNAGSLHFATLFLLLPELNALGLGASLNPRNRAAVAFLAKTSADSATLPHSGGRLPEEKESVHSALRWILLTGMPDDGLDDGFDQALDAAASLLIRQYGDADLLPGLVRLLFRRNRKGHNIHDLVWALFRSRNPVCLGLIAEYLRSPNPKDAALAQALLRCDEESAGDAPKRWRYASFAAWFRENRPYLAFTGDGFNRTCAPVLFRVDLDAKYLAARRSPQDPSGPFTQAGPVCLEAFHRVDAANRPLLARYSCRLHRKNQRQWEHWMAYPVEKQIQIAQSGQGGRP